tara:strand:- start:187 stop:369 length:183 start_codon:yes stop_codon:yes gene_type:complete
MQVGDLVKSNYPDMSGLMGVILEIKSVNFGALFGTVEQYRIWWSPTNDEMWMTGDNLEKI